MKIYKKRDPRELLLLALLLGLFVGGWHLQNQQTELVPATVESTGNVIRVVAPDQQRVTNTISPYGPGFERELVKSFAKGSGYTVQWIPAQSTEQALEALRTGRADLLIGSGQAPEAIPGVEAGPAYAHYQPILVRAEEDAEHTAVAASHVLVEDESSLENRLPGLLPEVQPASLTLVPQRFGFSTVLNSLSARTAPMALISSARFQIWQPFYPSLRPVETLPEEIACRWFWRTEDERFAQAMSSFWRYHETETHLEELTERYFGFFPGETPYQELQALYETMAEELPKYLPVLATQAKRNEVDPLLVAAVIYQESRFNPRAKSRTGAKGLLQFTTATARHFGLKNRFDPEESIRAGCEYLKMLYEDLEPLGLAPWDRWFFALAGYNQGPGHVRSAIALAERMGMSGRTWRDIKEVLPLMQKKRYAQMVGRRTFRGGEAKHFVESVRYYYYILHGIVRLARPESKDLGLLLDTLTGGSFAVGDTPSAPSPLS